jgi:hypothetical protein
MRAEYVWDESYKAAVFETDDKKLPDRIRAAKSTIDTRLQEMQMDYGGAPEEWLAITDALAGLNALRRELERRSQDAKFEQSVNLQPTSARALTLMLTLDCAGRVHTYAFTRFRPSVVKEHQISSV